MTDNNGSRAIGTVKITQPVSFDLAEGILEAAFDQGGINYWCSGLRIKGNPEERFGTYIEAMEAGQKLILVIDDGDDKPSHKVLNKSKLMQGFALYANLPLGGSPAQVWEDYDSATADCIIQLALFGELIYG